MVSRYYRAYGAVTALASACALWGGSACVQQRPSRNGVFNENQYLRKDFLVAPGDGSAPDPGWFVRSTITSATTPNVLGNVSGAGLFAGAEGQGANFVRFAITQDKLQVLIIRSPYDNYVDYIVSKQYGVLLNMGGGQGQGRVTDIVLFDPSLIQAL